MNKHKLRLILSDVRSAGNVGAIIRTADACAVDLVYACGITPYPYTAEDTRPPHVADANTRAIAKTALGAEATVPILHLPDTRSAVAEARGAGFKIIVLEQSEKSLNLYRYHADQAVALVLGNEVGGVPTEIMEAADQVLELPMLGTKESLNVAVSGGIALYHLRFT
jgi:tRNA G18 (ribose-2'-O)-methylase SpoU